MQKIRLHGGVLAFEGRDYSASTPNGVKARRQGYLNYYKNSLDSYGLILV
jgi:hypothetical protein